VWPGQVVAWGDGGVWGGVVVPAWGHVARVGEVGVAVAAHRLRGRALGRSWQWRDLLLHSLHLCQHRVQVLDVVDGGGQDLHPADLLLSRSTRDRHPQLLEALVDLLHPVPLSRVSPDRLRRICRLHSCVTLLCLEGNLSLCHHCDCGRQRILLRINLALSE